jgi:hypothetical protein
MSLQDYGTARSQYGYLDKIIDNTDNYGVFSFAACAKINKDNQSEGRCDSDTVGPVCITWKEGVPYGLPLNSTLGNVKYLVPIIDCAPHFYIIYSEWQESQLDIVKRNYDNLEEWQQKAIDNDWIPESKKELSEYLENSLIALHPQRHARTLGELFKLIIEWDIVSKAPFNNTEVQSTISTKILEFLDMPDAVRTEIMDNFPDTHVSLYLQGDPNATQRPSGVPNITPLFEEWVESKILSYQYRGPIVF